MAVSCWVLPISIVTAWGDMETAVRVGTTGTGGMGITGAGKMVTLLVVLVTPPQAAVTLVLPGTSAVTTPRPATVALRMLLLVQDVGVQAVVVESE